MMIVPSELNYFSAQTSSKYFFCRGQVGEAIPWPGWAHLYPCFCLCTFVSLCFFSTLLPLLVKCILLINFCLLQNFWDFYSFQKVHPPATLINFICCCFVVHNCFLHWWVWAKCPPTDPGGCALPEDWSKLGAVQVFNSNDNQGDTVIVPHAH